MADLSEEGSVAGRRSSDPESDEEDYQRMHRYFWGFDCSYSSSSDDNMDNSSQQSAEAPSEQRSGDKLEMDVELRAAVSALQVELVKSLIQRGASVSAVDPKKGETPLTLICKQQSNSQSRKSLCIDVINLLLENGASVNQQNSKGLTPLHLANSAAIVEFLIEKGAYIEHADGRCGAPLYFACKRFTRSVDVISALLEAGACVNGTPTGSVGVPWRGGSPLHVASVPAMKLLLRKGAVVDQVDSRGDSALFVHSGKPNGLDAVNLLLEHGASINLKNIRGRTPLFVPCQKGLRNMVELLLLKGACANEADKYGETPLFFAAKKPTCTDEVIKLLLANGASINWSDSEGRTPLHVSRHSASILLEHGATVDALDNKSETPLFVACRRQPHSDDLLSALLQYGASANVRNTAGVTPLHVACSYPHMDTVLLLLRCGADVNQVNNKLESPLFGAMKASCPEEVISALLNAGADVNLRNSTGQTPLHLACLKGLTPFVKLLLQNGASVNALDDELASPLMMAFSRNAHWDELITTLLEAGASVNVQNIKGDTLLHILCRRSRYKADEKLLLINRLLQKGAIVNGIDSNDKTPLEIACSLKPGDAKLIECLLDYGATVNRRDAMGQTPLHIACSSHLRNRYVFLELLQHGASVNATDLQGRTPFDIDHRESFLLHYGAQHCTGLSCFDKNCRFIRQHAMISEFMKSIPTGPEGMRDKIGQTNVTFYDLLHLDVPRSAFEEVLSTVTPKLLKSIYRYSDCHPNMIYCSYLKIKRLQRMDECSSLFNYTSPFLPPEVALKIFQYLDFGDLTALLQILNSVQKR